MDIGGLNLKILDDRGMLFGKVNIIDFVVVVVIISLLPMIYFGWKIYNTPPPPKGTPVTVAGYMAKLSKSQIDTNRYRARLEELELDIPDYNRLKQAEDYIKGEHPRLWNKVF